MMNKVTMLFFVLLMGTVQASDGNVFGDNPEEVEQTNRFETRANGSPPGGSGEVPGNGGAGGGGTGVPVPIDEYELGLLLIAFSIIAYQAKALRPRKQKI